jgi:hypothetical protein
MFKVGGCHTRRSNLLAVVQCENARLPDVHFTKLLSCYFFLCHFLKFLNYLTFLYDNREECLIFVARYLCKYGGYPLYQDGQAAYGNSYARLLHT